MQSVPIQHFQLTHEFLAWVLREEDLFYTLRTIYKQRSSGCRKSPNTGSLVSRDPTTRNSCPSIGPSPPSAPSPCREQCTGRQGDDIRAIGGKGKSRHGWRQREAC